MILLDTHALVWWAAGDLARLSPAAGNAIEEARHAPGQGLLVSAISCWEVAMLVSRGRLALTMEVEQWLELLASVPWVTLLPLDPKVAVAATRLPEPFHTDPVDRFLVAQARSMAVPLITADSKIRNYPQVRSLW